MSRASLTRVCQGTVSMRLPMRSDSEQSASSVTSAKCVMPRPLPMAIAMNLMMFGCLRCLSLRPSSRRFSLSRALDGWPLMTFTATGVDPSLLQYTLPFPPSPRQSDSVQGARSSNEMSVLSVSGAGGSERTSSANMSASSTRWPPTESTIGPPLPVGVPPYSATGGKACTGAAARWSLTAPPAPPAAPPSPPSRSRRAASGATCALPPPPSAATAAFTIASRSFLRPRVCKPTSRATSLTTSSRPSLAASATSRIVLTEQRASADTTRRHSSSSAMRASRRSHVPSSLTAPPAPRAPAPPPPPLPSPSQSSPPSRSPTATSASDDVVCASRPRRTSASALSSARRAASTQPTKAHTSFGVAKPR
mmetsp:Transcript_3171/g.11451  ORF Transcript_3171/g.11451 Transcript_3171/m.11451 type:complete len:365 (+) Transcript_3171:1178-2272(+)